MPTLVYEKKFTGFAFEVWNNFPQVKDLIYLNQTHSDIILKAKKSNIEKDGDGIISNDFPIAIKTADCIPIALVGENGFALVHAGWLGLKKEILANALLKELSPTFAFIGPHIRMENYEVHKEFTKNFPKSNNFHSIGGKIYFDMSKEVYQQLKSLYPTIEILDSGLDTFTDELFKSFRNGDKEQRNWNIIKKI
jgi:YfiH family protein